MWWWGGCAPAEHPDDTGGDSHPVLVAPLDEHTLDDSEERDTHPTFDRTADGGWIAAWDAGAEGAEKAMVREVSANGAPRGDPDILASEPGAGFLTPDVEVVGNDWYAVLRAADRIEVIRGTVGSVVSTAGPTSVGANGAAVGFWTAPDLALVPGGVIVGWWEGTLVPGSAASYFVTHATADLAVDAPIEVGASDDVGSPIAIEPTPDGGTLVAWSTLGADGAGTIEVRRFSANGHPGATFTLGADLGLPASRPSLAVDPSGRWAVGWRVQDDGQQGLGVFAAAFDADDVPVSEIWSPGLAADTANRVDLSAHDGILAVAWEEVGVGPDVFVQLVSLADASVLSGAVRVHDDPTGDQARPNVELLPGDDGLDLAVAWESLPADGSASSVHFRVFRVLR